MNPQTPLKFVVLVPTYNELQNIGSLIREIHAFQINLLNALLASGIKVREIPIIFHDRQRGRSKMRLRDIVEFFLVVMKIRLG